MMAAMLRSTWRASCLVPSVRASGRPCCAHQVRSITALIMGAPGSGKGTISKKMLKDFPFKHISTGDLLREQVQAGTELGLQAKQYMDSGAFVPDELIVSLLVDSLKSVPADVHLLLDGFPRTVHQAVALDKHLFVDVVVNLDIPRATIVERLTDRWVHASSGRVYAYSYNPPKVHGCDDVTGEPLIRRDDDKPEVVLSRLAKYESTSVPLLDLYAVRRVLTGFKGTRSDAIYVKVQAYLSAALPELIAKAEARQQAREAELAANHKADMLTFVAMETAMDTAHVRGYQNEQEQQQPDQMVPPVDSQQQPQQHSIDSQNGEEEVWREPGGDSWDSSSTGSSSSGSSSSGSSLWGSLFDD